MSKRSHTFRQRKQVLCGPSGCGCVFCFGVFPPLFLGRNCCLRLVGLSFFLPLYYIFSLHSTVHCQYFSRVVYVFEASAKLIQSRGGALWLGLSLQDSPQPVRPLSHCVIKLSRNCSQQRRACAQTKHPASHRPDWKVFIVVKSHCFILL